MLVLNRKIGESLIIGGNIKVTVLRMKGSSVKIGVEAAEKVPVRRAELPETPPAKVSAGTQPQGDVSCPSSPKC